MPEQDPSEISVRDAELKDAPVLASLMTQLGYPTSAQEMRTRLEKIFPQSIYRTFVAVSDGDACGMLATGVYESYEHNDPGGRILALVVDEKSRGKGVGHALMAAAEKDFAARQVRRIAVNTRFERERAHKFYEQIGFTRNGLRLVKEL